jgi:TonB-linked SusC/RagA family outer membrane protein
LDQIAYLPKVNEVMKINNCLAGHLCKIMKAGFLPLLLVFNLAGTVYAVPTTGQEILDEKVTLSADKKEVRTILSEITRLTEAKFVYSAQKIPARKTVSLYAYNEKLSDVLDRLLQPLNVSYNVVGKQIILAKSTNLKMHSTESQKIQTSYTIEEADLARAVHGRVTDETGTPLAGASVTVKGTQKGVTTGSDGSYTINAETGNELEVSMIGYQTTSVVITDAASLVIVLKSTNANLSEVVVTALGVKREEKALGYAVQKVSGSAIQTVKGVDAATSLTGQVSGLVIKNSTEFFSSPTIELRGESALLVIDGVPYGNMTLRDVPADDIANIDVLKGPTASALYGSRASGGVLLITTKKGAGKGISVNINSNTMFQLGFLAIPKVQSNYGRGQYGQIDNDYVWGPRLDAGNTATDWNPATKQFEDDRPLLSLGKNNLKNFMQTGIVTNNNISVSQSGEYGSFRASLNHIYNQGQFPNAKLNMYNFTLGGELKATDKFTLESHMGISRRQAPQIWGTGYGNQGYLYQLIMWTGPEYDIRQYRDYWKVPNETQNWMYTAWYDNPYLIAYEKLNGIEQNTINASLTANYDFTPDLKLMLRLGYDVYSNHETWRNPAANIYSTRGGWDAKGRYRLLQTRGWSTNDDIILSYSKSFGDWTVDAMGGGTIYRWTNDSLDVSTKNGLISPTFYSLAGSVEPPTITPAFSSRQVNSLFGRVSIGWRNAVFLDATGRNDWNSSQPKENRDYFYPSIGSSVVLSEFFKMPKWLDMWKIRGSWATFKTPADVYATNRLYSTETSVWNGLNTASYPGDLLGIDLLPSSQRTWEIGTAAYFFKKRLHADIAYFSKYYYNQLTSVSIPNTSGFSSTLLNTDETYVRRGLEVTLDVSVIKRKNFEWNTIINWSNQHRYYVNIDSVYSAKTPWVKKGQRLDTYTEYYWLTDPSGNVIHNNGMPVESDYVKKYGYGDPDFSFGFINNFTIGNFWVGLNIDGRIGGLMYDYIWDKMFDTGTNPETDNQFRYDEVVNGAKNYVGRGVKVTSGEVTYDNFGNIVTDSRKYAENDVPVSYQDYTQKFRGGDMGILSESFIKIRQLSVGYRFPAKILGKTGIKNASVALTGQNVFLWTKFKFSDPDLDTENLNAPSQRIVGIDIKLGF